MLVVLRLGHRRKRDKRISTHVGLVARAFGAQKIIFSGEKDSKLVESIEEVVKKWGGPFEVKYEKNWKHVIHAHKSEKFKVVHLTMYGLPLKSKIKNFRKERDLLIVVGGEKVPAEIFKLADYNIGIGNQPHSEVSALAVFLHEYFKGNELKREFRGAKLKIIPHERGKKVVEMK